MKNEDIYDGITDIREDIVTRTGQHEFKKRHQTRRKLWTGAVAAVLAVALIGGSFLLPGGSPVVTSAYAIAEPQYPEMAPYPNEDEYWKSNGEFDDEAFSKVYDAWREDIKAQRRPEGYADGLEGFLTASTQQFLAGSDGENLVYSPLNVYMALGMLAELTDGNSRQQIMDLLGSDSIESLRSQASDVWNANYRKDGAVSSVLASSVWLNEDVEFIQSTMDALAKTYYASSYQGVMGSEEYNKALQGWLNTQTGGLLEEQAANIELSAETIMALATTIYFQAKWTNEFSSKRTESGVFHSSSGDVTCDFMYQGHAKNYYWADQFGAVAQQLENGGSMWFLLPDEGVSVDDLLADPQTMDFILSGGNWENSKHLIVNQYIPKFDVTSQLDLRTGLQAMGVTDVFDVAVSDFSPMTSDADGVFLSKAQHDARVKIDEEGCTAAAYTVMAAVGGSEPPDEEMDFVLDRPFLFVITGDDGLPLFVGVVNQPV